MFQEVSIVARKFHFVRVRANPATATNLVRNPVRILRQNLRRNLPQS